MARVVRRYDSIYCHAARRFLEPWSESKSGRSQLTNNRWRWKVIINRNFPLDQALRYGTVLEHSSYFLSLSGSFLVLGLSKASSHQLRPTSRLYKETCSAVLTEAEWYRRCRRRRFWCFWCLARANFHNIRRLQIRFIDFEVVGWRHGRLKRFRRRCTLFAQIQKVINIISLFCNILCSFRPLQAAR